MPLLIDRHTFDQVILAIDLRYHQQPSSRFLGAVTSFRQLEYRTTFAISGGIGALHCHTVRVTSNEAVCVTTHAKYNVA